MTRCFTLPDLYAGKMHALLYRGWKNRVKGRDWYDFLWYVSNNIPLDFDHFAERVREFNDEETDRDKFMTKLKEKLSSTDIDQVKRDVMPFIRDPQELELWSNDFFLQVADLIKFS